MYMYIYLYIYIYIHIHIYMSRCGYCPYFLFSIFSLYMYAHVYYIC